VSEAVLDSSAVLAVLNGEPGEDVVRRWLAGPVAVLCSVNLAEVVTKLVEQGAAETTIQRALATVQLEVADFDAELAYAAGLLRAATRQAGLSLGDRACLALGIRLKLPVVTADRSWAGLGLPVEVVVVR